MSLDVHVPYEDNSDTLQTWSSIDICWRCRCDVDPHMADVIRHLIETRLRKAWSRGRVYERQLFQRFAADPEQFWEDTQ